MRLENLSFKNLRLFKDDEQQITFSPDKDITILLGNNGAGKTSLLHGISVLVSSFFEAFPEIPVKQFRDTDVRIVSNQSRADFLKIAADISIGTDTIHLERFRQGNSPAPTSNLTQIKTYSNLIKQSIDNNQPIELPILAYYGTERGQISAPERRRDFNTIFPRWDAYKDALEPATNFKRFFTWFERNEDVERRQKEKLRNFDYSLPVLNAVRRALSLLEENLVSPRVETSPLRFVMDDITNPDSPHEVRIEMLSDGYRIMIAMVADIAARMAEANPDEQSSGVFDPLLTSGIVLIDEIDLHLHPKWQRKVLHQLHRIFPNVQFLVTTHSPNVVIGALDIAQVVKIENGIIDTDIDISQYSNYDVSLLLLSNLFDLDNVRTDQFKTLDNELQRLLDNPNPTQDDIQKIHQLMYILKDYRSV